MKAALMSAAAAFSAVCASAPSITAAQTNEAQTSPCQADIYRAFDFWVGEWEVFGPDEQKAGESKITAEENGCLILEQWTSAQGGTGQSYNFYDPGTEKWRQIWISGGSVIDYAGGLDDEGAMVLEGQIAYRNGAAAPFKGTWTLLDDGSVKQHFQQYNAETKEWADWFVGIYRKKGRLYD